MATAMFQVDRHLYTEEGVTLPSVTQVLTLAGIVDLSEAPRHFVERAAAIGTAVHEACQYLDDGEGPGGDLDLESVHPLIIGYILGYQRFKQETGFVPRVIESRGIGETNGLRFGYCVDRLGQLNGEEVLLDLKTASKKQHSWGIQTAGYASGVDHEGPRLAVHLSKDGKYKLVPHDDEGDFEVWGAALWVAHWKLSHGGKLK